MAMQYAKVCEIDLKKALTILKKAIGNDEFYVLTEVCNTHGNNLLNIGKMIGEYANIPETEEEMGRIKKELRELPERYKDESIINKLALKAILENPLA